MLLRKWSGFPSLPSRYGGVDGGFQCSPAETRSSRVPIQESENTSGSPASFSPPPSAAELEKIGGEAILPSRSPFPSQLKAGGITAALDPSGPGGTGRTFLPPRPLWRPASVDPQPGTQANHDRTDVPGRLEYGGADSPGSALRRRNSLSHLPSCNREGFNSQEPLARKKNWTGSQPDLHGDVLEETPREGKLREAGDWLAGQPRKLGERNLGLEADVMEFELCSLKQKQMESSFAYLEKERKWLERIRSEGRKRNGELDDKIFRVEMELAKTKSYFGKRDHPLFSQVFRQSEQATQEKLDVGHELQNLQESLAALKSCIQTLEEKRNEMLQQLKCAKEGEQSSASRPAAPDAVAAKQERRQLQAAYKNINLKNVAFQHQVQHLSLELKQALKKQEEFGDQISALQGELARRKRRAHRQEEEKFLMKEEMESARQSNEELSSKAAESRRSLQALSERLHLLEEGEKSRSNHIRALEDERARLLGEKEQLLLGRAAEQRGQEETRKALEASCENLGESQVQLQKEMDLLRARCQGLERQAGELGEPLGEQQSVARDWRNRREEAGAALKTKEEELEEMSAQNRALQAKSAEWRSEKLRLQQLVGALEEQLVEKVQALRELRQTKDVDGTASETRTSSEPRMTEEGPGTCYEKGHPGGTNAKTAGNPLEGLRLQHRRVTEQLKDLFRQRQQQQSGARKLPDEGLKEKSSTASQNVPQVPTAALESLGPPSEESHLESGDDSKREEAERILRQQLKAKNDTISAMAREIQALKEKNEALMQAKVRFQEQIQQIRQLSKRRLEKSHGELQVPKVSVSSGDDGRSAGWREMSRVAPQSDETPSSFRGAETREQLPARVEEEQESDTRVVPMGPAPVPSEAPRQTHGNLSGTSSASVELLFAPPASPKGPLKPVEDEGALLSPRSSGLLSPKPFGPPRPWSPFRERAESPESRKEP